MDCEFRDKNKAGKRRESPGPKQLPDVAPLLGVRTDCRHLQGHHVAVPVRGTKAGQKALQPKQNATWFQVAHEAPGGSGVGGPTRHSKQTGPRGA